MPLDSCNINGEFGRGVSEIVTRYLFRTDDEVSVDFREFES